MISTLRQEISPHLLAQDLQGIELLVEELGPTAHAGFRYFAEPFRTMTRCIDCRTFAVNDPAALVHSSNVARTSPRGRWINCRIVAVCVSMMGSIPGLPVEFTTPLETVSLCTSMPIYFGLSIYFVLSI